MTKNNISLSICIPTFNRAKYIEDSIKNILPYLNKNIEIVIFDGASTDNTDQILAKYIKKYKNIFYYKAKNNGGVDRDYANCVDMATGKYCWLMSSDDMICNNSIDKIFRYLQTNSDIYLFNRTEASITMVPFNRQFWLKPKIKNTLFQINSRDDLMKYFNSVNMFGGIFSYAPSIIIKRTCWKKIQGAEIFYGTCYSHVYRLLKIMISGCTLQYIQDSLILCRMNNDSFSSNGLLSRFILDYDGYIKIANNLFSNDDILKKSFLNILKKEHGLLRLIKIRANINNSEEWINFKNYFHEVGYSSLKIKIAGFFGSFTYIINMVISLRKKYKSVF